MPSRFDPRDRFLDDFKAGRLDENMKFKDSGILSNHVFCSLTMVGTLREWFIRVMTPYVSSSQPSPPTFFTDLKGWCTDTKALI